jgi:hypothetical protein
MRTNPYVLFEFWGVPCTIPEMHISASGGHSGRDMHDGLAVLPED